jgi:ankyrin repeat protein
VFFFLQDGNTVLFIASEAGKEEVVELLVAAGANLNDKSLV